ncbi:hypothetical protein QTP88_010763 [Uroleucon formosanum]
MYQRKIWTVSDTSDLFGSNLNSEGCCFSSSLYIPISSMDKYLVGIALAINRLKKKNCEKLTFYLFYPGLKGYIYYLSLIEIVSVNTLNPEFNLYFIRIRVALNCRGLKQKLGIPDLSAPAVK